MRSLLQLNLVLTVPKSVIDLANGIIKYDGAVLIYDAASDRWLPFQIDRTSIIGERFAVYLVDPTTRQTVLERLAVCDSNRSDCG
jgi:hypothetical protein